MAKLEYSVKISTLSGANPPCSGWVFHHVLPWRYFFLASHTLCMFVKYQLATTKHLKALEKNTIYDVLKKEAAQTNGGQDQAKMKAMFGSDHAGFQIDTLPLDLLKLCGAMAQDGWDGLATAIRRLPSLDAEEVARRCTNPPFGGFAGMDSKQRNDDPDDQREPRRPLSGQSNWWKLLQLLGGELEAIAPAIGSLPDNRRVRVTVTEHAKDQLIPLIQQLVQQYNRVLPFCPPDWGYAHDRAWTLLDPLPAGRARGAKPKADFYVRGRAPLVTVGGNIEMCRDGAFLYFVAARP